MNSGELSLEGNRILLRCGALFQLRLAGSGVVLDPEFGAAPSTLAYQQIAAQ